MCSQCFDIDLDLAPEDRYRHVIDEYRSTPAVQQLRELAESFDGVVVRWMLFRPLMALLPTEQRREARAVARGLEVPLESFVVLQ